MAPATIDFKEPELTTDSSLSDYAEWAFAECYSPNFESRLNSELDRLGALPANWDREGANPIDSSIIAAARQFIAAIPENIASIPAVVPIAEGNLQLEWNFGKRSLELEFANPQTIHYLKWSPDERIEEESLFPIGDIAHAVSLIRWFMRGVTDV